MLILQKFIEPAGSKYDCELYYFPAKNLFWNLLAVRSIPGEVKGAVPPFLDVRCTLDVNGLERMHEAKGVYDRAAGPDLSAIAAEVRNRGVDGPLRERYCSGGDQ
jgi:hypothetical protein